MKSRLALFDVDSVGQTEARRLVRVLRTRAPVRAILLVESGRELLFARDLVARFADPVITASDEAMMHSLEAGNNLELVVIGRSTWTQEDDELCRRMRRGHAGVPLLGLAGPCPLEVRAAALRAADEFLSIPFEVEELVARALALVGRLSSGPGQARAEGFRVDFGRRKVQVDARSLELTLREFDVLAALIERPGEVVSRHELAARIGSVAARGSNIVDVHVSRIREKLGGRASAIETVRGIGYRFRAT